MLIRRVQGALFVSFVEVNGAIAVLIRDGWTVFDVSPYVSPDHIACGCIVYGTDEWSPTPAVRT